MWNLDLCRNAWYHKAHRKSGMATLAELRRKCSTLLFTNSSLPIFSRLASRLTSTLCMSVDLVRTIFKHAVLQSVHELQLRALSGSTSSCFRARAGWVQTRGRYRQKSRFNCRIRRSTWHLMCFHIDSSGRSSRCSWEPVGYCRLLPGMYPLRRRDKR